MIFRMWVIAALVLMASPALAGVDVGQKAPALVVKDTTGKDINLKDLEGKTVIVNLWATWCEPCLAEMPVLRDFYHQHEDEGVEIIALSLDRPNDRKAVEKIAAKTDVPVAMAVDAKENDFTAGVLPATYIIGKDGTVKAVIERPVTEEVLRKAVAN